MSTTRYVHWFNRQNNSVYYSHVSFYFINLSGLNIPFDILVLKHAEKCTWNKKKIFPLYLVY